MKTLQDFINESINESFGDNKIMPAIRKIQDLATKADKMGKPYMSVFMSGSYPRYPYKDRSGSVLFRSKDIAIADWIPVKDKFGNYWNAKQCYTILDFFDGRSRRLENMDIIINKHPEILDKVSYELIYSLTRTREDNDFSKKLLQHDSKRLIFNTDGKIITEKEADFIEDKNGIKDFNIEGKNIYTWKESGDKSFFIYPFTLIKLPEAKPEGASLQVFYLVGTNIDNNEREDIDKYIDTL